MQDVTITCLSVQLFTVFSNSLLNETGLLTILSWQRMTHYWFVSGLPLCTVITFKWIRRLFCIIVSWHSAKISLRPFDFHQFGIKPHRRASCSALTFLIYQHLHLELLTPLSVGCRNIHSLFSPSIIHKRLSVVFLHSLSLIPALITKPWWLQVCTEHIKVRQRKDMNYFQSKNPGVMSSFC